MQTNMVAYLSFVICLALLLGDTFALSSSKSPGAQFDLSNWKLTLPDSSASEKSPDQLEGGFQNTYFKTASDGAMAFYVPGNGGRTENAKYPRSELRHLCNPGGSNPDRYNWKVSSGTYTVSATYKIGNLDSSSRKVVIQQIHAYDGPPLVKIQWEKGKVYALVKTDASGNNEDKHLMGSAPQYQQFSHKITVQNGYLKLYLNNAQKYNINVKNYWSGYGNFFKAGNYIQSTSSSAYSYVYIYSLSVSTNGACSYTQDTLIFEDDEQGQGATSVIIAIVLIALFGLLCLIIGGYCIYKKKFAAKKDGDVINNDNDTLVEENDKNGDEETLNDTNGTKKPAYDMDEIEIGMEVQADDAAET